MKRHFLILLFLFTLPGQALAASTTQRVEDYLNSLTTVIADFTQAAPDGSLATGKFYLQRPGKMRWEYNPPTPILMVSNGGTMTYFDRELAQTSYIPIEDTPAGILVKKHITLTGELAVKRLEENPGVVRITLYQPEKADNGELTLEFSDQPLALRNLSAVDATGQETTVSFTNAVFGQPIDPALFTLKK